jgi:4-aminobutyrate--pyruvate transaminase
MSGDIASVVEVRSGLDRGFGHGFTYSGHPVAAAVALEALNIYQELELPAVARRLGARLHERLDGMRSHPMVGEIRGTGLIAGIELVADKAARRPFVSDEEVGAQVEQAMRARGLIVRNMGDVIALCPPYIISDAQIDEMVAGLETALDEVHNRQIANG